MPPPSSGGVTLIAIPNILQGFDLPALGHNSSRYIHALAEAMQYAFADRAIYIVRGDRIEGREPTYRGLGQAFM